MFWVAAMEIGLMEMPESGRITPAPSSSQNLMSFEAASEPYFEFHACIQVLGVFTDDDQVDVIVTATSAGHGQHRTQAYIQVERFAKRNVDAAGKPVPTGVVHGPLMATLSRFTASMVLSGRGVPVFSAHARTGLSDFPNDVCTCSFHDPLHCSRRFPSRCRRPESRLQYAVPLPLLLSCAGERVPG